MNGIILAGGRGTRLGPLAAQISKALVSVGNRPQLVNQVELLRNAGVGEIIVVTSPDTDKQVSELIARAGLAEINTVVQKRPLGPAHAITVGMTYVSNIEAPTYIIMSDTFLAEDLPKFEFVGVAPARNDRAWCYFDGMHYVDGIPPNPTDVTIGAYRFDNSEQLFDIGVKLTSGANSEVGMAPMLSAYSASLFRQFTFTTWQDVGDVLALGRARRDRFISRAHHRLELNDNGTITKMGASEKEINFMADVMNMHDAVSDINRTTLFPTVYDIRGATYTMEYVDLPSLAELWLYWPGRADTWKGIVRSVIDRVERDLWTTNVDHWESAHTFEFFGRKAIDRVKDYEPSLMTDELREMIYAGCELIGRDTWVNGHGDLNFTNILYSLNTNNIKLIDPRGGMIPMLYEYTKLAYSPIFSAITHNLFTLSDESHVKVYPHRADESAAVYDVLEDRAGGPDRLAAAVGLTMLAACALHPPLQAQAFFIEGRRHLQGALTNA